MRITGCVNKLTGLSVDSCGKTITSKISLRKDNLESMVGKGKDIKSIKTIQMDGMKKYKVHKVILSSDGEYYIFSV